MPDPADPTTDESAPAAAPAAAAPAAAPAPETVTVRELWTVLAQQGSTLGTMAEHVRDTHGRSIKLEGAMAAIKADTQRSANLTQQLVTFAELRHKRDQAVAEREEKRETARIEADKIAAERKAEADAKAEEAERLAAAEAASLRARTVGSLVGWWTENWKLIAVVVAIFLGINVTPLLQAFGIGVATAPIVAVEAPAPAAAPAPAPAPAVAPAPAEEVVP